MSARGLIEVMHQVISHPTSSGLSVIPILTDDIDNDAKVLETILEGLGGQSKDLRKMARSGVLGPFEEGVRADFVRGLIANMTDRPGFIIGPDDERVVASFGDRTTLNESTETLLGAALASYDTQLQAAEIAALWWDDDPLDPQHAQVVWDLLTSLQGEQLGGLGTLLLLVGRLDPLSRPFLGDVVPAFIMQRAQTHRMKRPAIMFSLAERLAQRHRDGLPTVYLLGAGFSCSSGSPEERLPMGDRLRDQALLGMYGQERGIEACKRLLYEEVCDSGLWTPSERIGGEPDLETFISSLTLERVLLVQFADGRRATNPTIEFVARTNARVLTSPSMGVRRFRDLLRSGHNCVVLTVNFDTLVEADTSVHLNVLATEEELSTAAEVVDAYLNGDGRPGTADRRIPLVKIHGTIDDPESVVADVGKLAQGLSPGLTAMLDLLQSESDPIPWIYVGHSMRDLDIEATLRQKPFALGTDEHWVDPFRSSTVETFVQRNREAHWGRHDRAGYSQRHVTFTADRFFVELAMRCVEPGPAATGDVE